LNSFQIESPSAEKHLFILHGLLSQGRNWRSFALNDEISKRRHTHLLDVRNHGESDHHESMLYSDMADDILRHADKMKLNTLTLLGHNVGAKAALAFACKYPSRVDGVISIDTAPKSNLDNTKATETTLQTLCKIRDLKLEHKTRKGALEVIEEAFSHDGGIANLIASNVVYDAATDNKYVKWCINIDGIIKNFPQVAGFDIQTQFNGYALFLNGALSVKNPPEVYTKHFPKAQLIEVEGAGHYLHTDKARTCIDHLCRFLDQVDSE